MVDDAPKAKWYYSDAFDAYSRLWYHFGRYAVSDGKEDTFSVEACKVVSRRLCKWENWLVTEDIDLQSGSPIG